MHGGIPTEGNNDKTAYELNWLTLFYIAALFLRFLHHDSYLGPPASVLLDPKCVAPGYMFSEAMFQVSKLNSKN